MSNEAFDRAVKALGDSLYGYVDKNDTPIMWGNAESALRTVLEAVREPSTRMIARGDFATNIGAVHVWRDMVDELLKP